jgi:flavorubredoxin
MTTSLFPNIDWVGYVDWTVRDFHGYNTFRGSTYNAYLIRGDKIALIDTVKAPYAEKLLDNVAALAPLDTVDYVVVNHAEPDHAGALPAVLDACPNATVVTNQRCQGILSGYHDTSRWRWQLVGTGDTLSLGNRTLSFLETPMVHWPDSMMTYVVEDKLLFSMDAFGQHYASGGRFDDQEPFETVMWEAKAYYANIIMWAGKPIQRALEAASALEIGMIAPSHGVIWRTHLDKILAAYQDWVVCRPTPKVLVVYESMWESTTQMARAIWEGACQEGVSAKLFDLRASNNTLLATEVLDAATIAWGSSTLNGGMLPLSGGALTYLKGLRPLYKAGFAFGSYGWSKGGAAAVQEMLQATKVEILREPLECQWRPTPEVLEECRKAGAMLAEKAMQLSCPTQPGG